MPDRSGSRFEVGHAPRLAVLLAVFLLLSRAAIADYDETEARLKAAGVEAPLRKQIHAAIDGGVAYLLKRQHANGGFASGTYASWYKDADLSALAGLALRHTGSREAVAAARRTIRHIEVPRSKARKRINRQTYLAGLALMLFMADSHPSATANEVAAAVAEGLKEDAAWWGYGLLHRGKTAFLQSPEFANLSTTQFGALGLWAAGRLDIEVDPDVWLRHHESLLAIQGPDGSWNYNPHVGPPRIGYASGTCMGLANLLLSRAALSGRWLTVQRSDFALRRGLAALDRDGPKIIEMFRAFTKRRFTPFAYYQLYALEKACIFSDLEKVGGVAWYVEGAKLLIRAQSEDGGWGPTDASGSGASWLAKGNTVDTAFALLFLLRTSKTYHPVSPRPVDSRAVTPSDPPEGSPRPADPPGKGGGVDLLLARSILDRLAKLCGDRAPRVEKILATLGMLETTYRGLDEKDAAEADRFRIDAEKALIVALVTARVSRKERRNVRDAVNERAAQILGNTHPRAAGLIAKALERVLFRVRHEVPEETWFRAFEAITRLDPAGGVRFLLRKALLTDLRPEELKRTRAALDVISRVQGLDRKESRKTAAAIVGIFLPVEKRAGTVSALSIDQNSAYWRRLRYSVIAALESLSTDPAGLAAPPRKGDLWLNTVAEFKEWLR